MLGGKEGGGGNERRKGAPQLVWGCNPTSSMVGNKEHLNKLRESLGKVQNMVELMEKGAEIIIYGVGVFTLDELLPIPFRIELDQIG